ncbi:MAG: carboxyl transferase [Candidatus Hydrogenedentota bacterium]|nr:MAG: carboxyl transferase [Candidatus Hydrogenedentota bacterium]
MRDDIEEVRQRKAKTLELGGADKIARLRERGHYTARERVDLLLDEGSFLEMGQLNHSDVPGMEEATPADGKVGGIGTIDARHVTVAADDNTVLAGSGGRVGGKKSRFLNNLAIEKGYPIINLGEGGGARIPDIMGSDGLSAMTIGQESGQRMRRVPMVATIMGECFGSPSWHAALSDFVVQQKGSCMAVAGPRVLELSTGEKVDLEELGGWQLHAEVTGQADRAAETEEECFQLVRDFLSFLPSNAEELPPMGKPDIRAEERQSRLLDLLPEEPSRTYDMTKIIRTFVDHEAFFPIKPNFDPSVVCGLARLDGKSVGIIASQPKFLAGAMGPDGCDKCAGFIALCDSFHIPLIFLHDTPGFMAGKAAEQKRMPGKIINFIEALSLATVPKVSVIIRKTYGMATGNMAGPGMGADFQLAWPTADISFVAPEVAANIVYARKIAEADDPKAAREAAIEEMRLGSRPWAAAGKGYLDDVIEPQDTRRILIQCLHIARGSENKSAWSKRHLANWPTTM